MRTYTSNVRECDRDAVAFQIEKTLNGLWETIIKIYLREGIEDNFLNQLVRHFIFLEKSMQYMAVDCKLEIFTEYNLENTKSPLYKLPRKFMVRPTDKNEKIVVDTITNKILKKTRRSFNALANINAINFSLIKNVYQDYNEEEFKTIFEYLDVIKGKYVNLRLIFKNEYRCLCATDSGDYYKFTDDEFKTVKENSQNK